MKGISPLIASVLLIAFTMAIAGILALFAKNLVAGQQEQVSLQTKCIGALELYDADYNEATMVLTIKLINNNNELSLRGLRADVTYTDQAKDVFYLNTTAADPLTPKATTTATITLTKTPSSVSAVASTTCPDYKAVATTIR